MKVEVLCSRTKNVLHVFDDISIYTSIKDLKDLFAKVKPKFYPSRQSFRLEPRGKSLDDKTTLRSLELGVPTIQLYFKDLGPQVAWKTVFLTEYSGPLFVYLFFYMRPFFIYGTNDVVAIHPYVHILCGCFTFHYAKRILETQFIHRFSNATMPIKNIFKNSIYYWGFAAAVSYFVNHPLYTPAYFGDKQFYGGLVGFLFCQLGNYSIHVAFRDLRPPGTKERKIPKATSNPFTYLFNLVSCPNYTYEIGSWLCFSIMSQTLTAGIFTIVGGAQMTVWAIKKHKNYRREFKDYPRRRKAVIPFTV